MASKPTAPPETAAMEVAGNGSEITEMPLVKATTTACMVTLQTFCLQQQQQQIKIISITVHQVIAQPAFLGRFTEK